MDTLISKIDVDNIDMEEIKKQGVDIPELLRPLFSTYDEVK